MINIQLNFPVLGIKENDNNLYVFSKYMGIVSKGGENFYKKLLIIDSKGMCYELKNSNIKGKAPFSYSVRYFQQMIEMDLEFIKHSELSLDDLKKKIIEHIAQSPRHWLVLDTQEAIKEMIVDAPTFESVRSLVLRL